MQKLRYLNLEFWNMRYLDDKALSNLFDGGVSECKDLRELTFSTSSVNSYGFEGVDTIVRKCVFKLPSLKELSLDFGG
eukprot:CAMPEP_0114594974 /NCGR_PEP_ID=MMETSP0125-20121206/16681_1 /TAXON_ID=485358 ORGANISM="Aristerostoma sp., Strain ATCC 50986" /NCGR_SAMPLE_ID=MMETSP0125 /ASSEMBLY_ACC=CAM_ASM_000245 /LENGTH=77 /DNA_ID=CAMNT_0001795915 /DNA_START=180 /DNA_END=410 /DNA_ORIENTATION=+